MEAIDFLDKIELTYKELEQQNWLIEFNMKTKN